MSGAVFTLRFRDQETLRSLERTAAALGVSTTDLAEAAIERELTVLGSDLDHRLTRALERLKSAGLTDLDRQMGGLQSSDLVILAGRPGMGKTALATNIAYNIARAWQHEVRADGRDETTNGGVSIRRK